MDSAMTQTLAMTIYDRTPEVIRAVCAGLSLPGNLPDVVCVCYDRAPVESIYELRRESKRLGFELREEFLEDKAVGPRCPSKAWNMALSLVEDDNAHVFCMSSEMVLAPHSIGMAYHMAEICPDAMIVGRAEHCGQSYAYPRADGSMNRTITWSGKPSGLGFAWLFPMKKFHLAGGFDEDYMDGVCYEDDDFVIRMWNAGSDMLFCDDIMGFHLEHKRDHLKNNDGRVSRNGKIFKEKWGDINYLKERKFQHVGARLDVGMSLISRKKEPDLVQRLFVHQKVYCQHEPWRAIPVVFFTEGGITTDIPGEPDWAPR